VSWLALLVAAPLLTLAGYFSRLPWLLPLLQVVPAYPLMVRDLRQERTLRAVSRMLTWAFLIAATLEILASHFPEPGAASVFHGAAYREEMIHWVRTGTGREATPSLFIPEQLVHLAVFVAVSLASGSFVSLALGAVLVNYMSFYVGSLLGVSARPGVILLCGWPPWAILRLAAYVILGVVLAGPLLRRVAGVPFRWENHRRWIILAAAGLLMDMALKTCLAGTWSAILRSALYPRSPGL